MHTLLRRCAVVVTLTCVTSLACSLDEFEALEPPPASLDEALTEAATSYDVPRDLVVAVAYSVSRLDDRDGAPSTAGGVGVMNVMQGDAAGGPPLAWCADELGVEPEVLQRDPAVNAMAGAAWLRERADAWEQGGGAAPERLGDWAPIVGSYVSLDDAGVQRSFARQVYGWLATGFEVEVADGEWVRLEAREVHAPYLDLVPFSQAIGDYAGNADFVPADPDNYSGASRGPSDIDMVVVHTMEGTYAGTISWFTDPASPGSAHYVMRSSDGEVTQMIWEQDIAWHAGHWTTNARSIGIELEGYISQPQTWYTTAMYESLAALILDIADRQGVPLDRDHVIGHVEVPGCDGYGGGVNCHTDPGTGFDWDRLMDLLGDGGDGGGDDDTGDDDGGDDDGWGGGTGDLIGYVREGSIYDSGAGVAGATVTLSSGQWDTTDASGLYVIEDVPAGWVEIDVTATGYDAAHTGIDVEAGYLNWRSVALTGAAPGDDQPPGQPAGLSPGDWLVVDGSSVTLDWTPVGAAADQYQVTIYFHDGYDWQWYYDYGTTASSKTFWPALAGTYYAWSVRGENGAGAGEWADFTAFYYDE